MSERSMDSQCLDCGKRLIKRGPNHLRCNQCAKKRELLLARNSRQEKKRKPIGSICYCTHCRSLFIKKTVSQKYCNTCRASILYDQSARYSFGSPAAEYSYAEDRIVIHNKNWLKKYQKKEKQLSIDEILKNAEPAASDGEDLFSTIIALD